ncbi:MAG: TonB-dependent receptor, partial [Acidobacteriota bacterium]|nr:TonB-dependent receptor [Acidobacteriota bacterium]
VGLREEVLSGGRSVLSPQAAGSYGLRHGLKARASVGYGFRLPTYVDLYYADPVHIPNPNLKPESAWNYEGGLDWYLGSRFRGSATVFYSRQSNAIDYVRANATQPYQAQNLTGLHFTGVEASAEWHPASAETLQASWTLLFGAQQALNGLQSAYIFNYPTNNASLRWSQSLPQGVFLHSQLNVVQRYQQTAYPVLGAALARESGRVHPFVQFANLTNTGYQEIAGVPMPGRSITGGVELLLTRSPR